MTTTLRALTNITVNVLGARGKAGKDGDVGPASGPLGSGSVTADTVSNDTTEQASILDKIGGYRRERLTTARAYYVRPDGSDTNTGLANSAGGAFKTPQKAVDTVLKTIDMDGFSVSIYLGDGTYPGALTIDGDFIGNGLVQIIGNISSPGNVILDAPSGADAVTADDTKIRLNSLTVQNTGNGNGLVSKNYAIIEHTNCVLDDVASDMFLSQMGGIIRCLSSADIQGNANSFCHATDHGIIDWSNSTINLHNNTFTTYAWGVNNAGINLDQCTIVDYMNAAQISVHNNGYMNANLAAGVWTAGCPIEMNGGGYISRTTAMANRTFYVRADGNDYNDGLADTAANGFKTINGALIAIAKLPYDPIMFNDGGLQIRIGAGTYAETVQFRNMPYPKVAILGDTGTPGNVIINGAAECMQAYGVQSTQYDIGGFRLNPASGSSAIRGRQGSIVTYHDVDFGPATSAYHVQSELGAQITATGNYSISGGANAHIYAQNAYASNSSVTVTLNGTPAFTAAFAYLRDQATYTCRGTVFSGSATGKRYDLDGISLVGTGTSNTSFLPGDTAGAAVNGSQYL